MSGISRETFFDGVRELERETVPLPGLGDVIVQEMGAESRDRYETAGISYSEQGLERAVPRNIRALLVRLSVVNDDGSFMFGDEDLSRIGGFPTEVVDPICAAARRLSRLTDRDIEAEAKN